MGGARVRLRKGLELQQNGGRGGKLDRGCILLIFKDIFHVNPRVQRHEYSRL
jgi:hypothetical protein